MISTDKTHGKPGHRCSTLCGAAMIVREVDMSTAEDRADDERLNRIHDEHTAKGENHWFTCPLCDDEGDVDEAWAQAEARHISGPELGS